MNALQALLLIGLAGFAAQSAGQHEGHAPNPAQASDPHVHHAPEVESPAIPQPTDADRTAAVPDSAG